MRIFDKFIDYIFDKIGNRADPGPVPGFVADINSMSINEARLAFEVELNKNPLFSTSEAEGLVQLGPCLANLFGRFRSIEIATREERCYLDSDMMYKDYVDVPGFICVGQADRETVVAVHPGEDAIFCGSGRDPEELKDPECASAYHWLLSSLRWEEHFRSGSL